MQLLRYPPALADRTRTMPPGGGLRPRNASDSPMGRDVAVGGPGRGRGPLVRPALPQTHHPWRPPVSTRVVLALELLKHELACSDEQICSRLRTDLAVMYACGIAEVQVDGSQEHFVLPEVLAHFRRRLDEPLMEELLAIQAATAMEEGLVSPAHLVVDTFPSEQGSQRVNDAATLYKAQKKSSRSSRP